MNKFKNELWYCNDISDRNSKMVEDVRYVEEERWKEQGKTKKKDKKIVR